MTRPRQTDNNTTCQNLHCRYHLKEKDKNIIKHGKNRAGHQIYKCLHCNTYFTQTKNTPLYQKHLTEPQITNICKHLVEKNGIRSIERLTGHHRDTIGNLLEDMAEHASEVNNYFMKDLGLSQYECDEIWTFIKKKEKTLKRAGTFEPESGDCYLYTAVKRNSYLFAAFSAGKWTQQTCLDMVRKLAKALKRPSLQCPLEVFTDGNDDYCYILPLCFQLGFVDYGQLIKIKRNGRWVVGKKRLVIYGEPSLGDIETTDVENFNSVLRERLGRLVRESKCLSKVKRRLVCAVELFKFYWNFINEFKRNVSPAKLEGLTDHLWSWHEFFYYQSLSNLS